MTAARQLGEKQNDIRAGDNPQGTLPDREHHPPRLLDWTSCTPPLISTTALSITTHSEPGQLLLHPNQPGRNQIKRSKLSPLIGIKSLAKRTEWDVQARSTGSIRTTSPFRNCQFLATSSSAISRQRHSCRHSQKLARRPMSTPKRHEHHLVLGAHQSIITAIFRR